MKMFSATTENASSTTQQDNPQPRPPKDQTTCETVVLAERDKKAPRGPFWLSKAALVLFFFLFAACAGSLVALDRHMASLDGLPLTLSSSSYSWTYGPTAILVVILSFWRRVEYYYKSSQPWRELHECAEPAPPERSLLLDYTTPFQGTSMVRAMKNGHHSVAATIFCFFLLKLIMLVSTTLFAVTPTLHAESLVIQYQNRFDAADAWASISKLGFGNREMSAFLSRSDTAVWAYLAKISNGTTNNTRWRLASDWVTQSFALPAVGADATSLEAPVDIFIPRISCEDATLSVSDVDGRQKFDFESATCSADGGLVRPCHGKDNDPGTAVDECPKVPRTYTIFRLNCSYGHDKSSRDVDLEYDPRWPESYESYDIRYAIAVTQHDVQTEPLWNGSEVDHVVATDPVRYSSSICTIGYGIASANATLNLLTGDVSFPESALDGGSQLMRNLSGIALAEMILASLERANRLVVNTSLRTPTVFSDMRYGVPSSALFQLMFAKLGSPADIDVFHQPSVLEDTFVSVMGGLATEFAREPLLVANTSEAQARGLVSEDRLHARPVALWAMVACFCLLALICLLLLFMIGRGPPSPAISGSIAGHAAILANSPSLKEILRDTGHCRENELRQRLRGTRFTVGKGPTRGVFLEATGSAQLDTRLPVENSQTKTRPWSPLAARLPVLAVTLVAPILAIGTLELLQRLSDQRRGLINMNENDSTVISYVVRAVSTLIIFAIATLFNNLDFTIVVFAPYSSLRLGSVRADRSIGFHLLSVSPFLVLAKSLRCRQFGPAASNLSSVIASFLTIVVYGLWIVTNPTNTEQCSVALLHHWDRSWLDSPLDDGGAALRLNNIRRNGSSLPPGIWEDVVLPEISLPSPSGEVPGTSYTYDVLALQPVLNCTVVPEERMVFELLYEAPMTMNQRVKVTPKIPLECSNSSANGTPNLFYSLDLGDEGSSFGLFWVGGYLDLVNSTAGKADTACPSVGFIFGSIRPVKNEHKYLAPGNVSALLCSQEIREVPVTITYNGDPASGQISSDRPPKRSPGKVQSLRNGTESASTLGFRLQRFINDGLFPFPPPPERQSSVSTMYDSFFDHLVHGPNGQREEELMGPRNVENLIKAVTREYSEYMRHVIDLNFRAGRDSTHDNLISAAQDNSSLVPSAANTEVVGTVSRPVTRLGIHRTSKVILQSLLAAVTIFGFLGYALVKIRGILPRDPCSIASTMSLLAGSQLCDRSAAITPQGAEFMSDRQLRQAFEGRVFSLGWWMIGENASATEVPLQVLPAAEGTKDGKIAGTAASAVKTNHTRFGVDVGECISGNYKV